VLKWFQVFAENVKVCSEEKRKYGKGHKEDRVHFVHQPLTGLLYQPQMIDDECGAVSGIRIGRGNRSTWRKPASVPLCPPKIPHDLTWARTRAAEVGSRRLTTWVMARPWTIGEYGAFDGMRIGWGNWSTRRKLASVSLWQPYIPHDVTWDQTRQLTAWSVAQPWDRSK
jgi:hypothetical protein